MNLLMEALQLADLDAYDSQPQIRGDERRYLCPSPACADKRQDRSHQCFTVNTSTGAYHCQRCGEKGKLRDFWTITEPPRTRSAQGLAQLRKRFALAPDHMSTTAPLDHADQLGIPITDAPAGAAYLVSRGISSELATAAGVRFSPSWGHSEKWQGAPAVLFPMRDESGSYIAAHGRYSAGTLKARTQGPASRALFETPGALQAEAFAITEAPIDALSLAALGLPAVAMVGKNPQAWIRRVVYEKRVMIATDADAAGESAAAVLAAQLGSFGAHLERLRPPAPSKDWNEAISVIDRETLARFVQSYRLPASQIEDPRDDIPHDTALWVRLLARAHMIDGAAPSGLFGTLHGLRCVGAYLETIPTGVRLVPGEIDPGDYADLRQRYLAPHADMLRLLLRTLQ